MTVSKNYTPFAVTHMGQLRSPDQGPPLALSFAPKLLSASLRCIAVRAQCRQKRKCAPRAACTTTNLWLIQLETLLLSHHDSRVARPQTETQTETRVACAAHARHARHRAAARRLHSLHFVETAARALQLHKQSEEKIEKEYFTVFLY